MIETPDPQVDVRPFPQEQEDRDTRGRFAPGNQTGNAIGRQMVGLRKALLDSVTAEDIAAITRTLIERAKGGDVAAAEIILGSCKPK